jgi:hypothetical protein
MGRRLPISSLAEKFTPLSLDELDRVAGGLNNTNQDPNQDPNNQTTQAADGAAFEQTQQPEPEPTAEEVQGRFQELQADYGYGARTHDIDTMSPEDVGLLSKDIMAGRLDGQLGEVVGMLRGLNPFDGMPWSNDTAQVAQLTAAVLERYADSDRPGSLGNIMMGQERVFTANYIESMGSLAMDSSPKAGLELFGAAAQAFDAAGRGADADRMEGLFTEYFCDTVVNRHAGEPGLVAGLVADGAVTPEQFRDVLPTLSGRASDDLLVYAYREFSQGIGGVAEHLDDPAVKEVHDFMVSRLAAEAASLPDSGEALADTFVDRLDQLQGLDLTRDLQAIYAAELAASPAEAPSFFEHALADAVEADVAGSSLQALMDWAYSSLLTASPATAGWQMVDMLLDLPATDQIDAFLGKVFADALKTDLNTAVIGHMLSEGVVLPAALLEGLLQYYDVRTDNPNLFVDQLNAIAREAGSVAAQFTALIPGAAFQAVVKEAADRQLSGREIALAADLLIADQMLPIDQIPSSLQSQIFTELGGHLSTRVWSAQTLHDTTLLVQGLVEAYGTAAMTPAIMNFARISINLGQDVVGTLRAIAGDAGMTLAVIDLVRHNLANYRQDPAIAAALDAAVARYTVGDALDLLAETVALGRLDADGAMRLITDLWPQTPAEAARVLQAEIAVAKHDLGTTDADAAIAALRADLANVPSPLIAAVATLGQTDLADALHKLAVIADGVDADIGTTLALVFSQQGVDIRDAAATALATMIANGELGSIEALAAIRTAWSRSEEIEGAHSPYTSWFTSLAGEMGYVRLVEKAESMVAADLAGTAALRALSQQFHDLVASGQFARAAIAEASNRTIVVDSMIDLLNQAARVADVFVGALFVDVLTNLGNGSLGPTDPSWVVRDRLRDELARFVTGDAATQAGWVEALTEALLEGQQSPAQIVAELELIVENAFAQERLKNDRDHYTDTADAREAMEDAWNGIDRIVASTGQALLAAAGTSAAARDVALDWFRAQMPGGQLAILNALPANHPEMANLRAIAAQRLDAFDWTAEKAAVDAHISVGTYGSASMWTVFQSEQVIHDLKAALALAGKVGESQVDVILGMAHAWNLNLADTNYSVLGPVVGMLGYDAVTTGRTSLVQSLALEVKSGETTIAQAMADLSTLLNFVSRNIGDLWAQGGMPAPAYWVDNMYTQINTAFTAALTQLGMPNAAVMAFMTLIDNGTAFSNLRTGPQTPVVQLQSIIAEAGRLGVSIDYVLESVVDGNYGSVLAENYALQQLQARVASGQTAAGILAEVTDGGLGAARAVELLREVAGHTNASFGSLLAGMLDSAEHGNARVYGLLATATAAIGAGALASSIGADVADGRLGAVEALTATLEIVKAAHGDVAGSLGALVAGAREDAAVVAAGVIKQLDDLVAAKQLSSSAIADVLGSIRSTLAREGVSLATADTEVVRAVAGYCLAGSVRDVDIAALIDMFDGTNPDAGLIDLWDFLANLPDDGNQNNNNNEDKLQLLVAKRLEERLESGVMIDDSLEALDGIYHGLRGDQRSAAYQSVLDMVEKAVSIASYVDIYEEARGEISGSAAHALAQDMVERSVDLYEARGAFLLYQEARESNMGSAQDFMQWVVGPDGQPTANRDVVLGGLALYMTSRLESDGTLSEADRTLMAAVQQELMAPEYNANANALWSALNAGAAQWEQARIEIAAAIAMKVGSIIGHYTDLATGLLNPPESATGGEGRIDWGQATAQDEVAYLMIARTICVGGPTDWAIAGGLFVAEQAMQVEAIRSFLGVGVSAAIDAGLKLVEMGRSVLVEGIFALNNMFTDQLRNSLTDASNAFYSGLASGDVGAAGKGLWNFVMSFLPFDEMASEAIEQLQLALSYLEPLKQMDRDSERRHFLGISFL